MPLDRTLLPCSLHPLHTCSVLFSPFPPLQSPPSAGVARQGCTWSAGGWMGWEELSSTRVSCPCLLSLCVVARAQRSHSRCACLSLQFSSCCVFCSGLFFFCLLCVSLRALCSNVTKGSVGIPPLHPDGWTLPCNST